MVSIIWGILSLCGVCSFSWWAVFIESIVLLCLIAIEVIGNSVGDYKVSEGHLIMTDICLLLSIDYFVYAFYRLFCGLTISPWWGLLGVFLLVLSFIIPGGCYFSLKILLHYGIITVIPKGVFVVAIIGCVLGVLTEIMFIWESVSEKRKN